MLVKIHDGTDSLAHLIRSYLGGYYGCGDSCRILWFFEPVISTDKSTNDCDVMIINSKDLTKSIDRSKLLILGEDIPSPIRQKTLLNALENFRIKNNIKKKKSELIKTEVKPAKVEVKPTKVEAKPKPDKLPKSKQDKPIRQDKSNKLTNDVVLKIKAELAACKNDYNLLVKVAANYGVDKETCAKYKHFFDTGRNGLLVMNIENRIRAKLTSN